LKSKSQRTTKAFDDMLKRRQPMHEAPTSARSEGVVASSVVMRHSYTMPGPFDWMNAWMVRAVCVTTCILAGCFIWQSLEPCQFRYRREWAVSGDAMRSPDLMWPIETCVKGMITHWSGYGVLWNFTTDLLFATAVCLVGVVLWIGLTIGAACGLVRLVSSVQGSVAGALVRAWMVGDNELYENLWETATSNGDKELHTLYHEWDESVEFASELSESLSKAEDEIKQLKAELLYLAKYQAVVDKKGMTIIRTEDIEQKNKWAKDVYAVIKACPACKAKVDPDREIPIKKRDPLSASSV